MTFSMGDWPSQCDNSILRELRADESGKDPHASREVGGAHYVRVRPTVTAPAPSLVALSSDVAKSLGLTPETCESEAFLRFYAGSVPEDVDTWATCYGASFNGRYGGQRGDGRAIAVGIVNGQEVQLKGAGITPFSRRFDGRAVLRSCVREFLASEHMHALGVPTTRALCVVTTGESVVRAWYDDERGDEKLVKEKGAVGTRLAPSFLRFGQLEIFHQKGDDALLRELAEHALSREYSHLLVQHPSDPLSTQLVRMFEEVCERQAKLVAEWLRVGYCQGNMNSDNSALGGYTLDYGPFGFMERYNPAWNPWVGGGIPYAFARQPNAAAVNLVGLSEAFARLVQVVGESETLDGSERQAKVDRIRSCVQTTFVDKFHTAHDDNCRRKLGLVSWDDEAQGLWNELSSLMAGQTGTQGVDFTLFWRSLSEPASTPTVVAAPSESPDSAEAAVGPEIKDALMRVLGASALQDVETWPAEHRAAWLEWAERYWARVMREASAGHSGSARLALMRAANPKYILRNWMAMEAYDAADRGDFSVVQQLHDVLRDPYAELSEEAEARWAQRTPMWARGRPGLAYLS